MLNEQPDLKVYSGVDSGGAWESSASSNSDKLLIMLVDQTYENYNEKSEILLVFQKKKLKFQSVREAMFFCSRRIIYQ